jgi:hypothetical protein
MASASTVGSTGDEANTTTNAVTASAAPTQTVLQRVTQLVKKDKDICKLRAEIFKVEQFLTSFVPKKVKAKLQGDINQGYGLIVLSVIQKS